MGDIFKYDLELQRGGVDAGGIDDRTSPLHGDPAAQFVQHEKRAGVERAERERATMLSSNSCPPNTLGDFQAGSEWESQPEYYSREDNIGEPLSLSRGWCVSKAQVSGHSRARQPLDREMIGPVSPLLAPAPFVPPIPGLSMSRAQGSPSPASHALPSCHAWFWGQGGVSIQTHVCIHDKNMQGPMTTQPARSNGGSQPAVEILSPHRPNPNPQALIPNP